MQLEASTDSIWRPARLRKRPLRAAYVARAVGPQLLAFHEWQHIHAAIRTSVPGGQFAGARPEGPFELGRNGIGEEEER